MKCNDPAPIAQGVHCELFSPRNPPTWPLRCRTRLTLHLGHPDNDTEREPVAHGGGVLSEWRKYVPPPPIGPRCVGFPRQPQGGLATASKPRGVTADMRCFYFLALGPSTKPRASPPHEVSPCTQTMVMAAKGIGPHASCEHGELLGVSRLRAGRRKPALTYTNGFK